MHNLDHHLGWDSVTLPVIHTTRQASSTLASAAAHTACTSLYMCCTGVEDPICIACTTSLVVRFVERSGEVLQIPALIQPLRKGPSLHYLVVSSAFAVQEYHTISPPKATAVMRVQLGSHAECCVCPMIACNSRQAGTACSLQPSTSSALLVPMTWRQPSSSCQEQWPLHAGRL